MERLESTWINFKSKQTSPDSVVGTSTEISISQLEYRFGVFQVSTLQFKRFILRQKYPMELKKSN